MSAGLETDTAMRVAAFDRVRMLDEVHGVLTRRELEPGFTFRHERVPLVNPQRGIHKPRQMRYLLSLTTRVPRPGGRVWYQDQLTAHRQIFDNDDAVDYAFMGTDPDAADNRWLREACENRIPIIYFLGVAPGKYQALCPTFVEDWDRLGLKARLGFGLPAEGTGDVPRPPLDSVERRYALRMVKQRLHQTSFREAVITAYNGRCAVSRLAEPDLLDAAHIVSDRDELLGQPVVRNGMPLSKLHHAAFDRHLIGVDPDYRLHVAERLLSQKDGPMLEALKKLHGGEIRLPRRPEDRPDPDRLAQRFEQFKAAA
jgi:putative restriction endonuclease